MDQQRLFNVSCCAAPAPSLHFRIDLIDLARGMYHLHAAESCQSCTRVTPYGDGRLPDSLLVRQFRHECQVWLGTFLHRVAILTDPEVPF